MRIVRLAFTLAAFSKAQRSRTCRSCNQASSSLLSTHRPHGCSVSQCPVHCSVAPTWSSTRLEHVRFWGTKRPLLGGKADIAQTLRFQRYCFAGPGTIVPDAGFLSFCWAVFFFVGEFANRLKQLIRSSCSFRKRQSCTDLAGAETCFGSGFIFSS